MGQLAERPLAGALAHPAIGYYTRPTHDLVSNWRAARVCQIEDKEAKSAEMTVNIGWKDYRKARANPTTGSRFLVGTPAGRANQATFRAFALAPDTTSTTSSTTSTLTDR
jgi:hypothetical protein